MLDDPVCQSCSGWKSMVHDTDTCPACGASAHLSLVHSRRLIMSHGRGFASRSCSASFPTLDLCSLRAGSPVTIPQALERRRSFTAVCCPLFDILDAVRRRRRGRSGHTACRRLQSSAYLSRPCVDQSDFWSRRGLCAIAANLYFSFRHTVNRHGV